MKYYVHKTGLPVSIQSGHTSEVAKGMNGKFKYFDYVTLEWTILNKDSIYRYVQVPYETFYEALKCPGNRVAFDEIRNNFYKEVLDD